MRKSFQLLAAAVLVLCFSGFAFGAETLIRVSIQPCLHGMPPWWDIQEGREKAAGLKFELQLYPSGAPQNEALAANKWDVGAMGMTPSLMAVLRYDAKIIGISNDESETNDIWVRPDSPLLKTKGAVPGYPDIYGKPEDWKGKKILVATISTGHYALTATLNALGLKDKDVQITNIEQAQAITAFGAGQGDIAVFWAPFSYMAQDKGWKKVSSGRAAKAIVPGLIVARNAFVKEKPDLAAKWLRLYMADIDKMRADPKSSEEWLNKYFTDYCGLKLPREFLKYEFQLRPLFPVAEQIKLMKDPQQLKSWAERFVEFFVAQGTLKAQDLETLKARNYGIEPGIMERVQTMNAKQ
ncbi:MAG: ABC transporter substrate-binding protein [Deltaproteobacteria bacterium]|jgi:ABC-type nitrate/sulfonate/bicarbonate transport system substrate-binding protein|nr:ABC transporter substrate-binding protein [Deltaproteobacteria bacterium]